jgi:hypothetical protein
MRFPISSDAMSDCARRRASSAASVGAVKAGELNPPEESSVGAVETPEGSSVLEELLLVSLTIK